VGRTRDGAAIYSQEGGPTVHIAPEDVIVDDLRINFCNKERDPTTNVKYFHKSNPGTAFSIEAERVGSMLPSIFEERIIRVFSRKRDEDTVRAVAAAFRQWWMENGGTRATPHPCSRVYNSPSRLGGSGSGSGSPYASQGGAQGASPGGRQRSLGAAGVRSNLVPPGVGGGGGGGGSSHVAQGLQALKRRRTDDRT
jgi:hypothetical protein